MSDVLTQEKPKIGDGVIPSPKLGDVLGNKPVLQSKQPSLSEKVYTHIGIPVRLGSRIIQIHQVPKFSLLPKGKDAKTIRMEQVKKIGSQFAKGTRDVIRGLSPEEEIVYMPRILGISASSDNWNDALKTKWAEFGIDVPSDDYSETGVELEVGFKEDPRKPGTAIPIDLDGYIKYNFCKANSDVATTDEQLDNPFLFTYFIVDKARKVMDDENRFVRMKAINRLFDQLVTSTDTNERNKIQWILETEGGSDGVGINTAGFSIVQKEMELEKFKDAFPTKFEELIKDPNLETKALIRKAVEVSVITQEGNSYFLDSKVIGSTLLDAVGYLSNPANQTDKLTIIARLDGLSK